MKLRKRILLPLLPLPLLVSGTARAASSNSPADTACTGKDPSIGRVKSVAGAEALAIARRFNQIAAGPLASLCRGDLVLASKASAVVEVNGARDVQPQELKSQIYYHYDGTMFIPGRAEAEPGKPGGMYAGLVTLPELWAVVHVGGAAGTNEKAEVSAAMKEEFAKSGLHVVDAAETDYSNHMMAFSSFGALLGTRRAGAMLGAAYARAKPVVLEATLTTGTNGTTTPTPTANVGSRTWQCRQNLTTTVLAVDAARAWGERYSTQAESRIKAATACGGDDAQKTQASTIRYLVASVADQLRPFVAPARLVSIDADGSFSLVNEGSMPAVGDYLAIDFPVAPTKRDVDETAKSAADESRTLGIVKIVSVDEKALRPLP